MVNYLANGYQFIFLDQASSKSQKILNLKLPYATKNILSDNNKTNSKNITLIMAISMLKIIA